MRRLLILLLLCTSALSAAHAQSVRWEAAGSGDSSEIQLVFENCAPEGDPQLPRVEGVAFSLLGRSQQTSIVNFSTTRSTILTYRVRGQRSGPIHIPSFSVQTTEGSIRVPAFTGGAIRSAADANVSARLELGSRTVWVGEVFPITYVLDVARRSFNQLGSNIEWNSAPLVVEDWSKFEPSETVVNGETRLHVASRSRGYAKTAGELTLNPANQLVNVQSGSIGFGLFQTPRIEQLSVVSNRPALTVRALPPAPAGFGGAVGQFKLTSKVVPTNAVVGEPVTWTLELSGTGNWPEIAGLPQREVSQDFSVVQPQARRTPAEGQLFGTTLSEDVVLVPTRAGNYTLPPVDFVYFDPASGSYKTASTPRTIITIAPPTPPATAAPSAQPTEGELESEPQPEAGATPPELPSPPLAPIGIPREPLAGTTTAMVPWRNPLLIGLVLLPFGLVLAFWGWLAVRRARHTDPERDRREARERLTATLGGLRTARGEQLAVVRSQLLLQWQHDSALLWRIPHAAPNAAVFAPDAAQQPVAGLAEAGPGSTTPATTGGPASSSGARSRASSASREAELGLAWSQLWIEADRALYSTKAELPHDWVDRAEAALTAKRVPGFRAFTALRPRNLLPFVAAVALGFLLAPSAPAQSATAPATSVTTDPIGAYRRGEFAAAEKAWAQALARTPTDPIVRHNLSLALAQQDRWGEAAAHAAAAFVQSPGREPLRWQLALAAGKAGYVPAPLDHFLPPGPIQSLAQLASPGTWQLTLATSAALFAAAIAALLVGLYRRPTPRRTWSALGLMAFAALLAAGALVSLRAWGPAADRRAVVAWRAGTLRSIPTEADTTQKTVSLPAGSVALADKQFLGWVQLEFENGQTGWVRNEDVVALWR